MNKEKNFVDYITYLRIITKIYEDSLKYNSE